MLFNRSNLLISSALIFLSCTGSPLSITDAQYGSSISLRGTITNEVLHYYFKPCRHCKTAKDTAAYIYFQGDTLCFSVQTNNAVENAIVTAYFKNPVTGKTFEAERIEIHNKTVYGFSLVGSLLEKIYIDNLRNVNNTHSVELPFSIHILIEYDNQQAHTVLSDTMHIHFR